MNENYLNYDTKITDANNLPNKKDLIVKKMKKIFLNV